MLSVKLVRSLVLNETIHHDNHDDDDHHNNNNKKNKKMPMLLFTKTKELINDTFRLSDIASHLGMNFHPSPTLSHLLFSWPVSSNETVPIPFPSLSTSSSISLLRSFVSLSRGFFKLVFLDFNPNPNPNPNYVNYYHALVNYDPPVELSLYSRVSGRRVKKMDELGRELMGKGWSMFRSKGDLVYLFRKTVWNRVLVNAGTSRVKELRLSRLDFENGLHLRVLLYVLLITDDVFYLA